MSVGQRVGEQDDAEDREDRGRHQRDRARVPLEPVERAGELAHREPDREERHSEPERVGDEQHAVERAMSSPPAAKPSTAPSTGPMQGCPPEAERGARDRRRDRPEAVEVRVEAELLVQARRREDLRAGEVAAPSGARDRRRCG